jgi:hypothetical protein
MKHELSAIRSTRESKLRPTMFVFASWMTTAQARALP